MKKLLSYLLLLPIYFYQKCISPLTSPSCRFTPTCSQYAVLSSAGTVKMINKYCVNYQYIYM